MEDRASGRMHMVAAMLTAIGRATRYAVVLCDLLAVLAVNAIGIEIVLEPFEAGCVIGKLRLEGF
jgi:hypothetical protein